MITLYELRFLIFTLFMTSNNSGEFLSPSVSHPSDDVALNDAIPGRDLEPSVTVPSREIEEFDKHSPQKKYECFQRQSYKIKQLRRRLRKYTQKFRDLELQTKFMTAKGIIKKASKELPDQEFMLDNLINAIERSKLRLRGSRFSRICEIVKVALKEEPKGDVNLEEIKYKNSHIDQESQNINGDKLKGNRPWNQVSDTVIDNYLTKHAATLKEMSYEQLENACNRVNRTLAPYCSLN